MMVKALGKVIQAIAWALGAVEFSVLKQLWATVELALPAATVWWSTTLQPYTHWINVVDAWLPLGYMFTLFGLYWQFWAVVFTVRLTIKLIPFVG